MELSVVMHYLSFGLTRSVLILSLTVPECHSWMTRKAGLIFPGKEEVEHTLYTLAKRGFKKLVANLDHNWIIGKGLK